MVSMSKYSVGLQLPSIVTIVPIYKKGSNQLFSNRWKGMGAWFACSHRNLVVFQSTCNFALEIYKRPMRKRGVGNYYKYFSGHSDVKIFISSLQHSRCRGLIHRPLWEFQYWGELLRRWPFLSMNFALVRQIHPIMTLHTLETVFWLACLESNVASFMTVRSDLTASYVLIVIKHSSVRSVLILQNRLSRTRIKLDIVFWLTVFRVRVEITKQNKYSKVIWPCGFIPCCFGSSRCQVFFIFRLLFFSMFYWYWFDYLVCDTFCVFSV